MTTEDPKTPEEWQEAVDGAEFLVCVHAAHAYGLLDGEAPEINLDRCQEILRRGRAKGITPSPDCIEVGVLAWNESVAAQDREPATGELQHEEDPCQRDSTSG